jgi:CubicO group peptidase (beta-lactamase class C family)
MRPPRFIRVVLLSAALCSVAAAQPWADSLRTVLNGIASRHQLAGMSAVVIKNDQKLFSYSYGQADIGRSIPVTDSTQYRIASISKTVTTIALMQLYEQGLFGLDEDVSRYLGFTLRNPNFPGDSITFRKILSHTSSLRDSPGYDSFLSATYANSTVPPISGLLLVGGPYYNAGTWSASRGPASNYFAYANVNFAIIGTLIERLSGIRFDIYCRTHLFAPLGLPISFNAADLPNINNVAVLYRKSGGTWNPQADNFGGVKPAQRDLSGYTIGTNGVIYGPQGGLRTSALDLAVFSRMLMNGGIVNGVRLLQDSTAARMRSTVWSYSGSNGDNYYGIFNAYALGNHPTADLLPGKVLFGHPGEAYGLISDMYGATDGSFAIVFITNGSAASYQLGSYSGWYRVEEEVYTACFNIGVQLGTTVVESAESRPTKCDLMQNWPNPFNPETGIRYQISGISNGATFVSLKVFDLLGREVATLVEGVQPPGTYHVTWNAAGFASGVYICRLQTGDFVGSRKMLLLR